ncbi:membrane-spanning 4-domains subfamily A member 15-like isoform X2 [Salarias fasciatus]|uniref:membrane-spanning 4-domains subfamily A member 15-like isoform X2 n=1 Tax=Salarias fasciatus TaxID=181472 RepID=UPI0011767C06|nr:membrane-spanning 4-domains subfamily A member 15-like isoform X2 [Salarias fasciatus]
MASSTVLYTPGNAVVVTHVLPAAPNREQQPSLDRRHNFRKGHPQALGTVQIMIGALTLLFGIATAAYEPSLTVFTGMFVWAALIYITSGALTVAAEKHLSRRLINTSLAFNIIAAMAAAAGVFLYAFDPVFMSFMSIFSSHDTPVMQPAAAAPAAARRSRKSFFKL